MRFVALWDCKKGKPIDESPSTPFYYENGDYFRVEESGYIIPDDCYYGSGSQTLKLGYKLPEGTMLKYVEGDWVIVPEGLIH